MILNKEALLEEFPLYETREEAVCWKCGRPLTNVRRSPYPVGSGAWVGFCKRNKVNSWFDVVKK
jgi:hypothetical protein